MSEVVSLGVSSHDPFSDPKSQNYLHDNVKMLFAFLAVFDICTNGAKTTVVKMYQ